MILLNFKLNPVFICNYDLNKKLKIDVQTTKLELLKTILEAKNAEFIQKIADFVKNEQPGFWDELRPSEIRQEIKDLDKGKRVSYNSFLTKIS